VIVAGGLNWPTLLVAVAFPPYFVIRKAFAVDSAAAQLLELAAMLPFTVLVLTTQPSLSTVAHRPGLIFGLLLLGLLSAAGFALYLTASRVLPFALFGVLGYVEPVLLLLVSLTFLGEPWQHTDTPTYLPICLGLALLALEAITRRPRRPSTTGTLLLRSEGGDPRTRVCAGQRYGRHQDAGSRRE
jgi:chloramphenicol-sensitive protein RarD